MNITGFDNVLLVITSPPSLEGEIVDWLLSRDGGTGFSSASVNGHSTRHDHLTVAEQVLGRQRRMQFQVQIAGSLYAAFLRDFQAEFAGADLRYWAVPVLDAGQLD